MQFRAESFASFRSGLPRRHLPEDIRDVARAFAVAVLFGFSAQTLATFVIPSARTLLENSGDFHVLVIGSPPGIHRTAESAARAEGTFKYRICRETTSFWTALAFMLADSLAEQLHHSLTISSPTTSTSTPSRASSSTSDSALRHTTPAPQGNITPSSTSHSRPEATVSPIIYSHVCTLRGIVSSNYYPSPTLHIRNIARPLGELAARYLASHGYGAEDIEHILQARRRACTNEDFSCQRGHVC